MKCQQGLPEKGKSCQKKADYKFRGRYYCEEHLNTLRPDMDVHDWLNDPEVENPPIKLEE